MADRCVFKDGKRRCSRNGFGKIPLCRTHSIQASVDGKRIEFDKESPLFDLLDMADRAFSRSNNDFLKQAGALFGEYLSGTATRRPQMPPPPRQPPPVPPRTGPDPREVLGFEPGEALTEARVKARKRDLALIYHPDKQGGSMSAMKRVNEAADELLKSL